MVDVTIRYIQLFQYGLVTLRCKRISDKLQDLSHRVTAIRLIITVENNNNMICDNNFSNNMNVNYINHFFNRSDNINNTFNNHNNITIIILIASMNKTRKKIDEEIEHKKQEVKCVII